MGGCVTWRSHPAMYPGTLAVIYSGGKTGMPCPDEAKRRRGRAFCRPGVSFIVLRRVRGISCQEERVFIQVDELGKSQRRSDAV